MSKVLLTDAQQRKTLAAVRSLGRKGIRVTVGEVTRWAPAVFSKYCSRKIIYPDPREDSRIFAEYLLDYLSADKHRTMFPMDDPAMDAVIAYRKDFEQLCLLLLPDTESYNKAADKSLSVEQAEKAGLHCPGYVNIRDEEELTKLPELVSRLSFPLVIKPRRSSGSRGITVVEKKEDLPSAYKLVHKDYPFPSIQEYIPSGPKHNVCLLYDHSGSLKASFVQKEIRNFPPDRGPSTVQESVWRPDLVAEADRLLRSLNWKGIAEVEFMQNPRDGRDVFMEINPRFWGSLYLSIISGVDFPWLYYCLALDKQIPDAHDYQVGLKCRWLLPGDILYLFSRGREKMDPPFLAGKSSGVYDDILSLEDPMPTLGFFLAALYYLPNRKMWKFMFDR